MIEYVSMIVYIVNNLFVKIMLNNYAKQQLFPDVI